VLTADRHARRLSVTDFPVPVEAFTRVRIPKNFNGRNPQSRRDLASTLRNRTHNFTPPPPDKRGGGRAHAPHNPTEDSRIESLRRELRAHPCHGCPDREDHARWAERHHKLARDTQGLRRRIEQRTNTIARQFDRVCDLLSTLGYLHQDRVTVDGQRLMRLYSDMDLVAAECLRQNLWGGLSRSELAAALSTLVFESRHADDAAAPRVPGGRVRETLAEMVSLWGGLDQLERDHGLNFLREPDLGFAWAAYRWAEGASLGEVLAETDLAAGDFVRWMKQLLDVTDQVADAAGDGKLRKATRATSAALRHGVVAYSSVSE
jgi:ATP-dependent RNA helicase HelY